MLMPKWITLLISAILVFVLVLLICMTFSGSLGEKTLVNETITLNPKENKTYYMPPGFATVKFTSDVPVDDIYDGVGGSGEGHRITSGSAGIGTLFGARYTISNPGSTIAHISLRGTTGVLNPFGYL
jgi:hypothetical protein